MAVEDANDLAIFFSADEFGAVATITPNAGAAFDVEGLFDQPSTHRGVQQENQYRHSAQLSDQVPTFRAPTALLAAAKAGRAVVTILDALGVTWGPYTVHDAMPDGLGTTTLRLMK